LQIQVRNTAVRLFRYTLVIGEDTMSSRVTIGSPIIGNTDMTNRIRAHHWAATPLGPLERWSETLIATVNLMLHSPFPTILSWGPEMVFLYNDAAVPTLMGKHPSALGALYRDVFREAWDLVSADLEACFYRGESPVRDNMFIPILLNGVIEDHYWSYSLIPVYEDGKIAGFYDAYRNMTEIVTGARKLRDSETRLTLATEVAQLGIFVWHLADDRASWENDRMYEIFGRSRESDPVNGQAFLNEVVHPDFRESFNRALEATIQTDAPFFFEGIIRLPGNTQRWIEANGHLQSNGSSGQILGTIRDITRIKETEKALEVSLKRAGELAAIVESSDDVILSKDLNGIITSWNPAAIRLFGYSAEEMIGSSILKIIPEHLHSDEKVIIESLRAGRRVEHFETVRVTKAGQLIDVSLTISPVFDDRGQVIGASKILRDISGRKKLEKSLLQAEKIAATGRMAATIAHEINNPLQAIVNLLSLLRPAVSSPEGIKYLDAVESELIRVSHIARQTLGYYRDNASAINMSLSDLVLHAVTIYEPRCRELGIEVRKSLDSSKVIALRRGEMMQVISNLLSNSIYAMQKGGVLSISVKDAGAASDEVVPAVPGEIALTIPDEIVLVIEDNGAGIPADVLPKVFDAFFTTRSTVGTGIGLFIARQFVEGHGGRVEIESSVDARNHGTIVRIFLPVSPA
jgi:PAS domain S-box-containing protein